MIKRKKWREGNEKGKGSEVGRDRERKGGEKKKAREK